MQHGVGLDIDVRRSRSAALGLLVFAATLPLQWQVLTVTPLGIIRYFHLGAIAMLLLARPSRHVLRQMREAASPAALALGVLTILGILSSLAYSEFSGDQIQHVLYAFFGLYAAAALTMAMAQPASRALLAWTAPIAVTSFLVIFTLTSYSVGLNPLEAVRTALFTGSQNALHIIFRAVFETGGLEETRSNTRHEIFLSLLVALYISYATATKQARSRPLLIGTAIGVLFLVAVSLSRAALLAVGLVVAAAIARKAVAIVITLVLAVLAPFVGGPLYRLVEQRIFEDTQSYEGRLAAFDITGAELIRRLLVGGPSELESTHTMIGDAALRSGILAALAAAVLVGVFATHTLRALRRFYQLGTMADLAVFGAGAVVMVRAFTAGGGLLHQVEWVAFGLVIAMELWRRQSSEGSAVLPDVDVVTSQRVGHELDKVAARRDQ